MINKGVHRCDFFSGVIFEQMAVITLGLNHALHMIKQGRWLKTAVGFFAQMENIQARGQILIIGCFFRNQIGGGFDQGFMNLRRLDAVEKLQVGLKLHFRHRYVIKTLGSPGDYFVDFIQI